MSNMKRIVSVLVLLFCTLFAYSQNTFEQTITFEDGVVRECNDVAETRDHGFIVSCISIKEYGDNDALIAISPEGEITASLIHQIDGKNLKYCILLRHPDYDNEYLAIATLIDESLVQNTFAFLHIDAELNILSQSICFLGDD